MGALWRQHEGIFMKRAFAFALVALAAACTPAPSAPEALVLGIYEPLVSSGGQKTTPLADMPLSDELKALVAHAEESGKGEPVFDGDFAGNCQDCGGFKDLKVKQRADANNAAGRAGVEATFKLFQDQPKAVTWDLVETPAGWRVDNILSEGIDLRKIAQETIDGVAAAQATTETDEAVECLAYVDLAATAAKAAKPPGDVTKLEAASAAWRKKAEGAMKPDELAQYYASSVAVLDDLTPADLKSHADECVFMAPPAQ
jgi:hypothetical protein